MPLSPRPHQTAETLSQLRFPLRGLLCSFALLVASPCLAVEPAMSAQSEESEVALSLESRPDAVRSKNEEAQGPSVPAVEPLDAALMQATADKLAANTRSKVDLIVHGRTQRMMDRLRRINDQKMATANRLAVRINVRHARGATMPPADAYALAKNPPDGDR
jgi:hypothetical protein